MDECETCPLKDSWFCQYERMVQKAEAMNPRKPVELIKEICLPLAA